MRYEAPPAAALLDAEIRFRFTADADQRDAAKRVADGMREAWMLAGAAHVKLECVVRPQVRARAPEIAKAKTTIEKLRAFWRATGRELEEGRRARLEEQAVRIERKVLE